MGLDVQIEFVAKTTVRVRAYVTNDDDALTNPTTSIKVIITDPDGTVQVPSEGNGDDDMSQVSTGIYEYYYKTTTGSTKGWWQGEVVVIDGTDPDDKTSTGHFSFRIK